MRSDKTDKKFSMSISRKQVGNFSAAIAIAASTLWDFRINDLRVFDFISILFILIYLACRPRTILKFNSGQKEAFIFFILIIVYAILGYILHGHRSSIAIILLALLSFILIGRPDWTERPRFFAYLLIIHIITFYIQFIAQIFFNFSIDYHTILGANSRTTSDSGYFRASGLFQEPNSFSLNLFILGTIIILQRKYSPLLFLAAVTMALSKSLWGIIAALYLLLIYIPIDRKNIKLNLVLILIFSTIFNLYIWFNDTRSNNIPFIYDRIINIFSDGSFRERYIQNTCDNDIRSYNDNASLFIRSVSYIFGNGLSTHYFTQCLAANGVSFLVKALGLVGFTALLGSFMIALRGLTYSTKLFAFMAIGFSFTTYPLVTYLLFWLWLTAIINLSRLNTPKFMSKVTVG